MAEACAEFTERVLILKTGRFRETDIWVRYFSPSRGVQTAFAFGGCKSRKRFCGCLDPLNQVVFKVKCNRTGEYLCLEEGTLVASFPRLRHDFRRLGAAVNCLKFLEAVQLGAEGAQAAYDLLLDTLGVLDEAEEAPPVLPLLFRARIAFDQGYVPDFTACAMCGTQADAATAFHFMVEQGRVVCGDCLPGVVRADAAHAMRLPLSGEALKSLEFVCGNPPRDWARLCLSPHVLRECSRTVDSFVQYHMGLAWDRGGFRRI
ncbi:MAG: DNA repair protein RecO [Desulfovibrionaceae bacterium]